MSNSDKYLLDLDDELLMREGRSYAIDKLYALKAYLSMARISMKDKKWAGFNYIDLQAGPGKNKIDNRIYLGSPLISLEVNPPFDHYWFNELGKPEFDALQQRIVHSPLRNRVHLTSMDANEAIEGVTSGIQAMDREAAAQGQWSTFNVAFLDPEGLEIKWATIEKLAQINRMDLIINFSTMGIFRNMNQDLQTATVLDEYFGTSEWRSAVEQSNPIQRRRALINLYRNRLEPFGYHITDDFEWSRHDISMRNSKNAEVYSLIFASKHPLGDDFWKKVKDQVEKLRHGSPRLL